MSDTPLELKWVHPPLQERSQQTMERLLTAAEELIFEVGFPAATVSTIAKRAESSVGAFYARFQDKDALLRCLLERFVEDTMATTTHSMQIDLWRGSTVESICATLVHFIMRMLNERRELMRAIAHMSVEDTLLSDYRKVISSHWAEGLHRLIHERGEEFGCSDPKQALQVVAWTCLCLTESSAVGATHFPAGLSQETFEAELCTMILAHLQIRPRQDTKE